MRYYLNVHFQGQRVNKIINWVVYNYILLILYDTMQHNGEDSPKSCPVKILANLFRAYPLLQSCRRKDIAKLMVTFLQHSRHVGVASEVKTAVKQYWKNWTLISREWGKELIPRKDMCLSLHWHCERKVLFISKFNTLRTGLLNCLNARSRGLNFRHRASSI